MRQKQKKGEIIWVIDYFIVLLHLILEVNQNTIPK